MQLPRPTLRVVAIVLLAATSGAACSSSSKSSDPSTSATTSAADASCPFQGSTDPQTTPAGPVPSVTLQSVAPMRVGCIDQVQFNFQPATAGSQVAYEGTSLRVKLLGTTLGSAFGGKTSVPPTGLAYVQSIQITTAPGGEVDWVFTLDKVRPFLVSSAEAPYYIQVAIG